MIGSASQGNNSARRVTDFPSGRSPWELAERGTSARRTAIGGCYGSLPAAICPLGIFSVPCPTCVFAAAMHRKLS